MQTRAFEARRGALPSPEIVQARPVVATLCGSPGVPLPSLCTWGCLSKREPHAPGRSLTTVPKRLDFSVERVTDLFALLSNYS